MRRLLLTEVFSGTRRRPAAAEPWSRVQGVALDLLARTRTLRIARTREERQAVYRFRYRVYAAERNRGTYPGVDHGAGTIVTEDDEAPCTTHYYFGTPNRIRASVKVRAWAPGATPAAIRTQYQLEHWPELTRLRLCDTTQLMVAPELRGSPTMLLLTSKAGEHAIRAHGIQACLAACAPGLVAPYERLGFRDFGAPPTVSDVFLIPMVCLVGDVGYARRAGVLWRPVLDRQVREGVSEDISDGALARSLTRRRSLMTEPSMIRRALARSLPSPLGGLSGESLDWLLEGAVVLDVPADTRVATAGVREHEMYVTLSGSWLVGRPEDSALVAGPGHLFGAGGFFAPERRRPGAAWARSGGRVLMLRHSRLRLRGAGAPTHVREAQDALYELLLRDPTVHGAGGFAGPRRGRRVAG